MEIGMLVRRPLLASILSENEPAGGFTPYQSFQIRKFSEKKRVSPDDLKVFRARVGTTSDRLVSAISPDKMPKTISYPSRDEISAQVNRGQLPKRHHFATNLPDHMLKPMARTVRHLERLGMASGGRHDEKAAKVGYYRMTFHPDDDEIHGMPAAQRSRMAMDHIVHHYPEMSVDYHKDETSNGRYVHHLEIAHHAIPQSIRHLK
jgi:hypothetical protein